MQATFPPSGHLSPQEAHQLIEQEQVTVVDLRSQDQCALGHLPGAVLIPVSELESRLDELDPENPVLVYHSCQVCSWKAVQILQEHDFTHNTIGERQSLLKRDPSDFKNVTDIDVLTETQATSIDRDRHQVETVNLKTGQQATLDYDKLVLATGAAPVVPPWKAAT